MTNVKCHDISGILITPETHFKYVCTVVMATYNLQLVSLHIHLQSSKVL